MNDLVKRAKLGLGLVCFHVWMSLPLRWHQNRAAMWLLGWAGYYAHAPRAEGQADGQG